MIRKVCAALIVVSAFTVILPAMAKTPSAEPAYAPTAQTTHNPQPSGCVPGKDRTFTFEGHIVGSFSPASIDIPQPNVYTFLRLDHPISVCGYVAVGARFPAYVNVGAIQFAILSPAGYRFIMKWWGKDKILITAQLSNIGLTSAGGGPIIFEKPSRFCYSSKFGPTVFLCEPWEYFEKAFH